MARYRKYATTRCWEDPKTDDIKIETEYAGDLLHGDVVLGELGRGHAARLEQMK